MQLLRRRPVLAFFLISCAFSWPGFFLWGLGRAGLLHSPLPAELPLLAEYGPTVAGLWMSFRTGGGLAVRGLLARGLRWRVHPFWYLFVLFSIPLCFLGVIGVRHLLGLPGQDWSLIPGWGPRFVDHMKSLGPSLGPVGALVHWMEGRTLPTVVGAIFVAIESGGMTEEFGWRGYAQTKLRTRWSPLRTSVVVGVLWGLWHLGPWFLFFTADAATALGENAIHILDFLLGTIPFAVMMGWVYERTKGSVLLAILFHAAHNTTSSTVFNAWPEFPHYWYKASLWIAAAAIVACDPRMRRAPGELPSRREGAEGAVGALHEAVVDG